MTEIKAVIFDLDNTLLEFGVAKIKACRAVVELVGKSDEMELVHYFLGNDKGFESHENIADYLKDHDLYTDEAFSESCRLYDSIKIDNIEAYDGVHDTLVWLKEKGYKLGVVTDAEKENAVMRLDKLKIHHLFDAVVTLDMTWKKKPAPDSLELALKMLEIGPQEAVLVGDSLIRDIGQGKALGMLTVYASYGDKNLLQRGGFQPDFRISEIKELREVIGRMIKEDA